MKNILKSATFIFFLMAFAQCSSESETSVNFTGEAVDVRLNQVETNDTGGFAVASGKLVAKNSVNVSTRMMGYITNLSVEVGQKVTAGQTLISINNTEIKAKDGQINAQISQAQAHFDSSKKDLDRFKNLFASQSASQKELDDMQTRFDLAKAGLEAAKQMKREVNAQYRYTNITAPISGVVTAKFVEQGDLANPGMPLLTLESSSALQAQLLVSEQYITQVENGMPVQLTLSSTGKKIEGKVVEISPSSAHSGGQYQVKLDVNPSDELLAGMYVNAVFPFENSTSNKNQESVNIVIPKSALVKKGQMNGVYTVSSQNTAVLRWLKLGKEIGEEIEVLSGLNAGESYVVSAEGKLYNGVKLNVK